MVGGISAGGNVSENPEKWLKEGKSSGGQGGRERKKADWWRAVRHKALNYTVQASQE